MGLYVDKVVLTADDTLSNIHELMALGTTMANTAAGMANQFSIPQTTASAPPTIPAPSMAPYSPGTLTPQAVGTPSSPSVVGPPSVQTFSFIPDSAPAFDLGSINIAFPDKPVVVQPFIPDNPVLADHPMPDSITVTLPDVPTLRSINLPIVPTISLPTFGGNNPHNEVPMVTAPNFIWSESDYQARLPQLTSKIIQYLGFDFDAAETAIWERGQERIDRNANIAVLDLTNDFASRGLALPSGTMLAAVSEIRAKAAETKADNARDAMIKAAELNTQKLVTTLQTGLQYESQFMTYQTASMQRQFEGARVMVDVFMKVTDAQIQLFNSKVQAYATDAQVYRDLIQAELAKLESYKAQLEGLKLIGELNMQDVEIYKSRLQAVMTGIEVYKAQISAVVASIEVDKQKVETFTSQVGAFRAQVDANTAQYNAWAEQMRGEGIKAQVYDTGVRALGSRVEAYRTVETTRIEGEKLGLTAAELQLKGYEASLQGYESYVKGYMAMVSGISATNTAAVQAYGAVTSANVQAAGVNVHVQSLGIDAAKANATMLLEHAHKLVVEAQENARLQIEGAQGAAKVYAQLAASALSSVHLSESFGQTQSVGNSLQESYSTS